MQVDSTMENWFSPKNSHSGPLQCILYMITPNGRFKVRTRLCFSMSDAHPESWNPTWSVGTILTGLLSFMLENTSTQGSFKTSEGTKRRYAVDTHQFNLCDQVFVELFPGNNFPITCILTKYHWKRSKICMILLDLKIVLVKM